MKNKIFKLFLLILVTIAFSCTQGSESQDLSLDQKNHQLDTIEQLDSMFLRIQNQFLEELHLIGEGDFGGYNWICYLNDDGNLIMSFEEKPEFDRLDLVINACSSESRNMTLDHIAGYVTLDFGLPLEGQSALEHMRSSINCFNATFPDHWDEEMISTGRIDVYDYFPLLRPKTKKTRVI